MQSLAYYTRICAAALLCARVCLYGLAAASPENRYVYEFCPFDNVTQTEARGKRGRFLLGLWSHWLDDAACDCDEAVESDGNANSNDDSIVNDGIVSDGNGASLSSSSSSLSSLSPDAGYDPLKSCRSLDSGLSNGDGSSQPESVCRSSSSSGGPGIGLDSLDWSRMVYTDGDNCSDFGPRRTVVEMQCGASGDFSVGEVRVAS